jgi:Acetyltransferases
LSGGFHGAIVKGRELSIRRIRMKEQLDTGEPSPCVLAMDERTGNRQEAVAVRLASHEDLADILACIAEAYEKYIVRMGKKPAPMFKDYNELINNGSVYVLKLEDTLAGVLVLLERAEYVLLDTIAVAPRFQGRSLGRQLFKFSENYTRLKGQCEIRLCTNEKMYENIEIYNHCGYEEYARGEEAGYNRVFFKKSLC